MSEEHGWISNCNENISLKLKDQADWKEGGKKRDSDRQILYREALSASHYSPPKSHN